MYECVLIRKLDISKKKSFTVVSSYFCGALIFVDFIVKWINEIKVRNMTKTCIGRAVVHKFMYPSN